MSIFAKTEQKLILMCMGVFAAVLIVFASLVGSVVTNQIKEESRADLRRLVDAVVASIDFDEDEEKKPSSAEPDLIVSEMPESSSQLLNSMKLEWFNFEKKLTAQKGSFKVTVPLDTNEGFVELKDPRGIMYTKPVVADNQLLGYVRVAQPLDKEDRAIEGLKNGLLLGTLAALVVSGIGTAFLVRQSMEPVFKNMQQLRQFTADASHELRNPIAAILTNSAVALKHAEGMRTGDQEKFELIEQSSKQMQRMVEGLLLLSRTEHVERVASQAKLEQVAQKCVSDLKVQSAAKNTSVELNIDPDIELNCDGDDLYRLLSNLIENAISYTGDNGTVRISALRQGATAVVKVEDNGVGIAQEDLEKIYDRFWRADKSRNYKSGNQGLGLAIVKALVEHYQGNISVQSALGKGSTFTVALPLSAQTHRSDVLEKST
ncbi:MAG: GHKL domain-containing protein [Cyanobacteria bacterium SZAS-4]|nr:GHKL domain-containing protein [Cyanobacteria bacterium SZAS-4]